MIVDSCLSLFVVWCLVFVYFDVVWCFGLGCSVCVVCCLSLVVFLCVRCRLFWFVVVCHLVNFARCFLFLVRCSLFLVRCVLM